MPKKQTKKKVKRKSKSLVPTGRKASNKSKKSKVKKLIKLAKAGKLS